MKIQINKLWLAALPLAFVACQNEDVLESAQPVQQKTPVKALVGNLPTEHTSRAQIQLGCQDDYTEYFQWNAGDSFAMYYANQENDPYNPAVFQIDSSYSDDAPSANANFSTNYEGFYAGDNVMAFYPVPAGVDEYGDVNFGIDNTSSYVMTSGTDEEWRDYFSRYMYMKASTTLEEGAQQLQFEHMTYIIRVTYTNNTDVDQKINTVSIHADGYSFGSSVGYDLRHMYNNGSGSWNWMERWFSDLTVPAGEKKDIYFLTFGQDWRSFGDDATLSVVVNANDCNVETLKLPLSKIAEANGGVNRFEAGKRYWFNVTQTGNDLDWDFAQFDVPTGTITNLPFIQALENQNGLQFEKDASGFVDVSNWHNFKEIYKTTYLWLAEANLDSLDGLEYFTNLIHLYCFDNNLTYLNLSNQAKLQCLECNNNKLQELDLSANPELYYLRADNNELTAMHFGLANIVTFCCQNNHLASLDISNFYYESDWDWYRIYCGQQTDQSGNPMTMNLILRMEDGVSWGSQSQVSLWERCADDPANEGVVLQRSTNFGGGIENAE